MEYKKLNSQGKKEYYLEMEKVIDEFNNNGKKTVVIVNDNYYPIIDGVLTVIDNYAKNLKEKLNVLVCAPTHRWKIPLSDTAVLFCKSTYFHPLRYDYSHAKSDKKFRNMLDKLRIALMHIHSPYFTGRFMIEYANERNIPVVSTFHTQYHQDLKRVLKLDSLKNAALDAIMKVFHLSDIVLTMNTATRDTLRSYGYNGDVKILPNGTDMSFDGDMQELKDLCNNTYGLDKDETVLLFVGRLIKPKNIFLILEAIKHLAKKQSNFKMIYVGDGDGKSQLKDKIREYGLQNKVLMTGKVMDKTLLKSLYCRAQLFLFPSIYDSDGVVKYEAAAFETPSLLLAGSNAACGVTDNVNGFLCDDNPVNMARKIEQLMQNPELLQQVGQRAKCTLYKQWDEIADMAYEIYVDVIDKNEQTQIVKGKKNMRYALKHHRKRVKRGRKKIKFLKKAREKIARRKQKQDK